MAEDNEVLLACSCLHYVAKHLKEGARKKGLFNARDENVRYAADLLGQADKGSRQAFERTGRVSESLARVVAGSFFPVVYMRMMRSSSSGMPQSQRNVRTFLRGLHRLLGSGGGLSRKRWQVAARALSATADDLKSRLEASTMIEE